MAHQILSQIEEIIKSCILSKRSIERKEQFAKLGIDADNNLYDLLWKYLQEKNPRKCMRFSSFPKEFSNPNTSYSTPAGLYAYNLKYAIDTYFTNYDEWIEQKKRYNEKKFSHIDYVNEFLDNLPFATNPFHYKYVIFFDIKEDTKIVDPISFADNGEYEKLVENFYTFLKLSLEKEQATGWFFEDTKYGEKFNKSLNSVNKLSLKDGKELYEISDTNKWSIYIKESLDIYKKLNHSIEILKKYQNNISMFDISKFGIDNSEKNPIIDTIGKIINSIKKFLNIKITDDSDVTKKNIIKALVEVYREDFSCYEVLSDYFNRIYNLIFTDLGENIIYLGRLLKKHNAAENSEFMNMLYETNNFITDYVMSYSDILRDRILKLVKDDSPFFNTAISLFKTDKNLFEKEIKKNINFLFYDILTKDPYIADKIKDKNNYELARVWYLCGYFANLRNPSKSIAGRFKTMLEQVCGIKAVIDSGTGLIHPNEMSQVWIANSTYIENVEIVRNINGFDNRLKDKQKISFFYLFRNQFMSDKFFDVFFENEFENNNNDSNCDIFAVIVRSKKSLICIKFLIYDSLKGYYTVVAQVKFLKNSQHADNISNIPIIASFQYIITKNTVNQLFKNTDYKLKNLNVNNFKRFMSNSLAEIDNDEDANANKIIINNIKKIFNSVEIFSYENAKDDDN